MLFIIT